MISASTHTAAMSSDTVRLTPARLSDTWVSMLRVRTAVALRTWPFSLLFTWSMS